MHLQFQKNVSLAEHTTLKVGGAAEYFALVTTDAELTEAIAFAKKESLRVHVLGEGSNVLAPDEGVKGLVVRIASKGIAHEQRGSTVFITAQAGELLDDVVALCVANGWWGIENLSHIPGTIGATPVQNVGAYGVEVEDLIKSVRVFNRETELFEELTTSDCLFGYRNSLFKSEAGKKYIAVQVTFALSVDPYPQLTYRDLALHFKNEATPSLLSIREAVMKIRAQKFPNWHEVGTAGSFFKNPIVSQGKYQELLSAHPGLPGFSAEDGSVKIALGWVLDKVLDLRGYREGNVATYANQALVLIADKNATAKEIEDLANTIVGKIKNALGIDVEWEVTKIK